MHLALLRVLGGPSLHADEPALLARLATDGTWDTSPGFVRRLHAWLGTAGAGGDGASVEPHLDIAGSDRAAPSGLDSYVVLAVRELSNRAGVACGLVRVGAGPDPNTRDLLVPRDPEPAMRALITEVVAAMSALGTMVPPRSAEEIADEVRDLAAENELGPSTRAIVDAAERRGIPWDRLDESSLIRLGWGRNARLIRASVTGETSAVAVDAACDKPLASRLLAAAHLPVPCGEVVSTADDAVAAAQRIGGAVVVKPLYGNHGRGVSVGLVSAEAITAAFEIAREYGRRALVEEQFEGRDYRVLVVGGRLVAAAERRPPRLVGDGIHTIAELIDQANSDPLRGEGHERPLTRIRPDEVVIAYLASEGRSLESVPKAGETVLMGRTANLSRGATAHDVTDDVHPAVRSVCERAARAVGLDVCGVDLVAPGVDGPLPPGSGIVEVNAAPGLRMHLFPAEGTPRDVGAPIVENLFPGGAPARIPIIAITGTNGKTTTTRLIAHALTAEGFTVGMTTTDGIWIGRDRIATGDMTGPASARVVLADSSVDVAVLETARGGLVRRGLAFDWADVALLTNVSADHLGQDGIRTLGDLYRIKRRLAERVRPGGVLVLNADDGRLARLPEDPAMAGVRRRVVYFSVLADNPVVAQHRSRGGLAFFSRAGWIVEADGGRERPLFRIDEMPMTMAGAARFQTANMLAACAALRARDMEPARVAEAMRSFIPCEHNAGRANLFRLGDGYVMLDYGHNPGGYAQVCALAAAWRRAGRRVTGIIAAPGDRPDDTIRASARIAAGGFTSIVVREDVDRRGREPGEVARVLCDEIRSAAPDLPCAVIPDAADALREQLEAVRRGSVTVLFYEKLAPLLDLLASEGAVPVDQVPTSSGASLVVGSSDRLRLSGALLSQPDRERHDRPHR
jgi:cyanophycin synthetase